MKQSLRTLIAGALFFLGTALAISSLTGCASLAKARDAEDAYADLMFETSVYAAAETETNTKQYMAARTADEVDEVETKFVQDNVTASQALQTSAAQSFKTLQDSVTTGTTIQEILQKSFSEGANAGQNFAVAVAKAKTDRDEGFEAKRQSLLAEAEDGAKTIAKIKSLGAAARKLSKMARRREEVVDNGLRNILADPGTMDAVDGLVTSYINRPKKQPKIAEPSAKPEVPKEEKSKKKNAHK